MFKSRNINFFLIITFFTTPLYAFFAAQDYAFITNCYAVNTSNRVFHTDNVIVFKPIWKTPNYFLIYNYNWTFHVSMRDEVGPLKIHYQDWVKITGNNTHKLVIPKYALIPSTYLVNVVGWRHPTTHVGPENPFKDESKSCHLHIKSYNPFAMIEGGLKRTVPAFQTLIVSARSSYDRNFAGSSKRSSLLKYTWRCSAGRSDNPVCSHFENEEQELRFRASYVVEDTIKIELNVSLKYHSSSFEIYTQEIHVQKNVPAIEIQKNCEPSTSFPDVQQETSFEAKCSKNCKSESYKWDISPTVSGFQSFGNHGVLIIPKNTLKKDTYNLRVELEQGFSEIGLTIESLQQIQCDIEPKNGVAYYTYFKIKCGNQAVDTFFEIFHKTVENPETIVASAYYPELENCTFRLPPSNKTKYFLRAFRNYQIISEAEMIASVEYKDPLPQIKMNLNADEIGFPEFFSLVQYHKVKMIKQMAFEVMKLHFEEAIINSCETEKLHQFFNVSELFICLYIFKDPYKSLDEISQIVHSMVETMKNHQVADEDPLLIEFLGKICGEILDGSLMTTMRELFEVISKSPETEENQVKEMCHDVYFGQHENISTTFPIRVIYNPTPDNEVVSLFENFTNPENEQSLFALIEQRKQLLNHLLRIGRQRAKQLALKVPLRQGLVISRPNTLGLIINSDGHRLAKDVIRFFKILIQFSEDFQNDTHLYDVLIFGWIAPNKPNPLIDYGITDYLDCQIWHATCTRRVTHFQNPMNFTFRVTKERSPVYTFIHYMDLKKFKGVNGTDLNKLIHVYRFIVHKSKMISISTSSTDLFKIATVKLEFPSIDSFTNISVKSNKNINIVNFESADLVVYLAFLPESATKPQVSYNISAVTIKCVRWLSATAKWIDYCKVGIGSTHEYVFCECSSMSVIGVKITNVMILQQEVLDPDIALELQHFYVIFLTMCTTHLIFYLFLVFLLRSDKEEYYFLADNNISNRFAYVVLIKTGYSPNAGTSSNVVIKMKGEKKSSEPHVLNYPDPEKKLLQPFGNDLFMVLTSSHLGNLVSIQLWFDSIGESPSWFCREVIIYDMQLHIEWYFLVMKWLSVIKGISSLTLTPTRVQTDDEIKTRNLCNFHPKFRPYIRPTFHSWFFCLTRGQYSYFEKITLMLSAILSTYASVLIFIIGLPKMELRDAIDDKIEFNIQLEHFTNAAITGVPIFVVHVSIAWCFRFSRHQISMYEQFESFSFIWTISCWVFLWLSILTSTTILMVYGFWVPFNTSLIWLVASMMTLVLIVFFYEHVLVILINCFFEVETRIDVVKKFHNVHENLKRQREFLALTLGPQLLRPYVDHLYVTLSERRIKKILVELQSHAHIAREISELFIFGIYIGTLYMVLSSNIDNYLIYANTNMKNIVKGKHLRTSNILNIQSMPEIETYIQETLLPVIHPKDNNDSRMMIDLTNKFLGVVRLRQQRVKRRECTSIEIMSFLNLNCTTNIFQNQEDGTFGPGWQTYLEEKDVRIKFWEHKDGQESATTARTGQLGRYPGGGYIALLGSNFFDSDSTIHYIEEEDWIDVKTKVLFIEFLTYNANWNVFNAIQLWTEWDLSGYMKNFIKVNTARMIQVLSPAERYKAVFFSICLLCLVIITVKRVGALVADYRSFLKDIWMIIDMLIIILASICGAMINVRSTTLIRYLKSMEEMNLEEILGYQSLVYWEDILNALTSILLCISTIRFWKFLRFGLIFRIFEKTITLALPPLLGYILYFSVILFAFAVVLILMEGTSFEHTSTFTDTIHVLLAAFLKANDVDFSSNVQTLTVPYITVLYALILVIYPFGITLIVYAYGQAQLEVSSYPPSVSVTDYVFHKAKYFRKFLRYKCRRWKGGEDVLEKVQAKSDRFLYLNSLSIPTSRLNLMTDITKCIFKNTMVHGSKLNNNLLMSRVCKGLLHKDCQEMDIFYKGRVKGKRVALICERKIDKVASVVNLLLQEKLNLTSSEKRLNVLQKCVWYIKENQAQLLRCKLKLRLLLVKINKI